jgi:hypothetical protein
VIKAAYEQRKALALAYLIEQATRPQTIGYSRADSPVGLAAWMLDHDPFLRHLREYGQARTHIFAPLSVMSGRAQHGARPPRCATFIGRVKGRK